MGRRALPLRTAPLIAALLAMPCGAAEVTERFCGYAYNLEGGQYRYTELHEQVIDGDRWVRGTIRYVAPDGSAIGRKSLSFDADPFIPTYRLELFGGRYIEGIDKVGGKRIEAFRKPLDRSEIERESVEYNAPAAADSGFHALIRARLANILSGAGQRFDFIVAGALDRFWFRVRKEGETTFAGMPAVRLVAEPDSVLSWVVDGLELTYEPQRGKLLEYRGPTNLIDPDTGDGYDVQIVFPSSVPADAPAAAVAECIPAGPA